MLIQKSLNYTGNKAGAWDSRLQTTEALGGYDWWMMDFLNRTINGQITLWIGFSCCRY